MFVSLAGCLRSLLIDFSSFTSNSFKYYYLLQKDYKIFQLKTLNPLQFVTKLSQTCCVSL